MKPYLLSSCMILSACAATSPWTTGGHIYRDNYAQGGYHRGHCPPGLAKKHNGCIPLGQAKKWRRGYPLPQGVIFHDLSPRMVIELGIPPAGHCYVRVAQDILLITIGTGLVIGAVNDLGNM